MNSRERMLIALNNGRPDRLPCQVHGWMDYYLRTTLNGMDWYEANEYFGFDQAIYVSPKYEYGESDLTQWRVERREIGEDDSGAFHWEETIFTPKGTLHTHKARNPFTQWDIEPLVKTPDDFALWDQFLPIPIKADLSEVWKAHNKVGDRGIIRSHPFSAGQGSPWQSFCILTGTTEAILMANDLPDFVHHALEAILEKTLKVTDLWVGTPADMVETGGGAGSNTVISPRMFREFCLPYDRRQHALFHDIGLKVVYHLCGGLMKMLEMVTQNGADGLETMTPPAMGGDCDLRRASQLVGDKLFFIGGFDQNNGFERGTPEIVRQMVFDCFEATRDHAGYIIAPSDHFFFGDPANLHAFTQACRECLY
ncbi:MAG TPA: uroporphyrinogen decarboxylase family protein [Anaerolineaceae bacterium]